MSLLAALTAALLSCSNQPPFVLEASRGADRIEIPAEPGRALRLGPEKWTITDRRVWRGLVNKDTGVALMHFSVKMASGDVLNDLVLKSGDFITLDQSTLVAFEWVADEEATRIAAQRPMMDRWGVRDGGRTSWSDSFTPGTGFERSDGAIVTLLERDADGTIQVKIRTASGSELLRIGPGQEHPSGVINAAVPEAESVLRCYAWQPGNLLALAEQAESMVRNGDSIRIGGVLLRLMDVQPEAVYVGPDQSPWQEVTLRRKDRVLRVRQGLLQRAGDWQIRLIANEP